MLNNIQIHLASDESKQEQLEVEMAEVISANHRENINAFQRAIPSLVPYCLSAIENNFSVFANKFGEANIVDFGQGRTLYGLNPEQEISEQVENFVKFPLRVSFNNTPNILWESPAHEKDFRALASYRTLIHRNPLPKDIDTLVIFGLGLGKHIEMLLAKTSPKNIVIYEPEIQFFKCSSMAISWKAILERAKANGIQLFLQLGKDGRDLITDMLELREHVDFNQFYVYQHYHHPVFDSLTKAITFESWQGLLKEGINFNIHQTTESFCPKWCVPVDLKEYLPCLPDDPFFIRNLNAFKKYFPVIYEEFKAFTPKIWIPVRAHSGDINLLNKENLAPWYSRFSRKECDENFKNFSNHPNKDGLVLGYSGEKLKHYAHYKFVKTTESLLSVAEDKSATLPSTIKSMIMFGLGVGYQLEQLLKKHDVEKLFICEPNRDFFYGSLFAIDWHEILHQIDQSNGRLYINIGDEGTMLFRDLLNQFYSIGPYILNHTYFYQSYYNAMLNQAIAQLREQLQLVISMGEYFDHAFYGIAHTKEGISRQYPLLTFEPAKKFNADESELPIVIVGNGPSLDHALVKIKEIRDNVILVSCGTALQVLHQNNISPDFHAEIEQNRTTFDWAARIGDFDFLKGISLLSCNGIHPDTCNLYKDVFIAFKEGESSTVSAMASFPKNAHEVLQFAFPTVTNFALNLFIKLGFKQVYLMGVDLGFKDQKTHHSKSSGYYDEQGNELYDYSEKNNMAIPIEGNFRSTVFTKNEFKLAKTIMEQSLASGKIDCYNCSDGAKILGAVPLALDSLLIAENKALRKVTIQKIKTKAFSSPVLNNGQSSFDIKFEHSRLMDEISAFKQRSLSSQSQLSPNELESLIVDLKRMLFASYEYGRSLLFYYLYGTTNYASALFSKLAFFDREEFEKFAPDCVESWITFLDTAEKMLSKDSNSFDVSHSMRYIRALKVIKHRLHGKGIFVATNSSGFVKGIEEDVSIRQLEPQIYFHSLEGTLEGLDPGLHEYVLLYHSRALGDCAWLSDLLKGKVPEKFISFKKVVIVVDYNVLEVIDKLPNNVVVAQMLGDMNFNSCTPYTHVYNNAWYSLNYLAENTGINLIIPKVHQKQNENLFQISQVIPEDIQINSQLYESKTSFYLVKKNNKVEENFDAIGDGIYPIKWTLVDEHALLSSFSKAEYAKFITINEEVRPYIFEDSKYV